MKRMMFVLAAASLGGIGLLAGCADPANEVKTGVAYSLTHGAGFVSKATVTTKGDTVTDASLEEYCLPTVIQAGADVAATDKVVVGEKAYYKTVSFGEVVLEYDAEAGYRVGETALVEWLKTESNVKTYFDAVENGSVSVTLGGNLNADVMTKKALSKAENGYWTREDDDGEPYSRWLMNRNATVNYVKSHGVKNLLKLTRSEDAVTDSYGESAKYWMDDGISTGATWVDLNSDTTDKGYMSYAALIVKAYEARV